MHTSELSKSTYTQPNVVGDSETVVTDSGNLDGGAYFQDCEINAATVSSGELVRRFDIIAFPQKGVLYTGTNSDGHTVPKAAVSAKDSSYN